MAYFFKKKLKNQYYLFAGKSKPDGKGNAIRTESKYIGPYDALAEYFQQADVSITMQSHFEYGLSRAIYSLSRQLGMAQVFHSHITKRNADAHLSLRIVMMVINRLASPCAKYSIEKWYSASDLCHTSGLPVAELESQKVYRAMDKLEESSAAIETAICKVISAQEGISFSTLYLDFTNQETYANGDDSEFLAHGHNKRGMNELLHVNISLCCDADSGIPFFHKIYPGNYNDKQFIHEYAKELRERLDSVGWKKRNLLVIDRGINGKDNFALLLEYKFDYVGGLIEREFPHYFAIPKSKLIKRYTHKRVKKLPLKIQYSSVTNEIYDQQHRIITFYNQENYEEKTVKLNRQIDQYEKLCIEKLIEYKKEIAEKTFESRCNNTETITKQLRELNKTLFPLILFKIKSDRFELTWTIQRNKKVLNQHIDNLGKHVLFTNRLDLNDKDILDLFFNKDKIEKNFQFLKANAYTNRTIVLGPMLHAKDERIVSHIYTCIIALQLYQIIRNRLQKTKLEITTQEALENLETISCYYTKILGKTDVIKHINPLTEIQKTILKSIQINIFD